MLFELENVAVKGRQIVFDLLKGVFKAKDVDLSPSLFCRYCICQPARTFVHAIIGSAGKTRLSEQKLIDEIVGKMSAAFTDGRSKLDPALKRLVKEATDRSIQVGSVTSLERDTADALASHLGLPALGVRLLHVSGENRCFAGAEGWLKLARILAVPPPCCVALATSGPSCHSVLAARMRCIVIPDHFTAFQDFGGSDYVADKLDDVSADRAFALLETSW